LIGVGSALRKARELRRLTLDEASRDTKLRVDQLRALEDEEFDLLLGEPYIRGALRTYSTYLGLNPDRVAGVYARRSDDPEPLPPPAKAGRIERAIMATRIRDNQQLAIVVAVVLLGAGIWLGVLSRGRSAPTPAVLPSVAATPQPLDTSIEAVLTATRDVDVNVDADGVPRSAHLTKGESISFTADRTLVLNVADGGAVRLTVSGVDYGVPGSDGKPWHHAYSVGSGTTPSPSG
jgi:cytoskeletal protein RodZ